MNNIVGISFDNSNRIEYFYTNDLNLKKNLTVIVETDNGLKFGKIVTEIHPIEKKNLKKKLNKVIRIASKQDYQTYQKNKKDAKEALKKCKSLVKEYGLDMNVLEASYTHDREQLLFKFTSDTRVDFRDLARELAAIYHTRIELRQIGVRDKAKEIGGIGPCGQPLCCARYLNEFDSVSIGMAKNQNLALNPTKINGLCGRLLCCLKYEDKTYTDCRKNCPKLGETVKTSSGKEGQVVELDVLNGKYKVETKLGIEEEQVGSIE